MPLRLRKGQTARRDYGLYNRKMRIERELYQDNGRSYKPRRWDTDNPVYSTIYAQLRQRDDDEALIADASQVTQTAILRIRWVPNITTRLSVVDTEGVRWSIFAVNVVGYQVHDRLDLVVQLVEGAE